MLTFSFLAKKFIEQCGSLLNELVFGNSCTSMVVKFSTNIYKKILHHTEWSSLAQFSLDSHQEILLASPRSIPLVQLLPSFFCGRY
jgi:hypothetical protein